MFRYELDTLKVTFHEELITYSDWIEVFIKWFYKSITEARAEKVCEYNKKKLSHGMAFTSQRIDQRKTLYFINVLWELVTIGKMFQNCFLFSIFLKSQHLSQIRSST